jgi:DNA-binding transcriptional regulator YdaS (Cro superfamily)
MTFIEWLDAEKGRAASLAALLGKSPAAISQWRQNGVPVKLMKQVRDFTGGEVTLDEMLPDPAPPQSSNSANEAPGPAPAKLAGQGA